MVGIDESRALVRYFWNHDIDSTRAGRTGFVSLKNQASLGLVRTHQYADTTTPYDRTVRAHFVLPHQVANPPGDTISTDYGKTLDLDFRIENSFTAAISADDSVIVNTSVSFSDSGGDGGGVTSRHWDFGDGNDTTATAPSHVYTSAGQDTVTLTKTHQYHGFVQQDTHVVTVVDALSADSIHGYYPDPSDHTVKPNEQCTWAAFHHGGLGSTSYQWQESTNGKFWQNISGETSQLLEIEDVGSSDFHLRFKVTRGGQEETSSGLKITVSSSGQYCVAR